MQTKEKYIEAQEEQVNLCKPLSSTCHLDFIPHRFSLSKIQSAISIRNVWIFIFRPTSHLLSITNRNSTTFCRVCPPHAFIIEITKLYPNEVSCVNYCLGDMAGDVSGCKKLNCFFYFVFPSRKSSEMQTVEAKRKRKKLGWNGNQLREILR